MGRALATIPMRSPPEEPSEGVTPPVIKPGKGLPMSPKGDSLTAMLNGLDVEHHWLAGKTVEWKTGNTIAESGGAASNGGAFVAAVCARLKVPMPAATPEALLAGSQYDWLVTTGRGRGWVPVETMEAQLLANQGWVVIAAWPDSAPAGERSVSGIVALVRPDRKPAAEVSTRGPSLILAGPRNRNHCTPGDGFPARAIRDNEVVYLAHRRR